VSVRLGRYGPYAQIGDKDTDEKLEFASLRPGQSMHTIALADALELFKLPRKLGESDGHEVSVGIGRFGPFAKRGSVYASLKKEDDPYTIDLARAVFLIEEKEEIARNRIIKEFPKQRHPGAQRPLRAVHCRRQAQRPHSQGPRAGIADAGGSAAADGDHRQADARGFGKKAAKKEPAVKKAAAKRPRTRPWPRRRRRRSRRRPPRRPRRRRPGRRGQEGDEEGREEDGLTSHRRPHGRRSDP
jgi:DNA topoisomerase-1